MFNNGKRQLICRGMPVQEVTSYASAPVTLWPMAEEKIPGA
ncbi:MAG: hypothetical protein OJF50_001975 [Nitrospira sp.]|nr:hypothetical protein [Nitrospira sp.]